MEPRFERLSVAALLAAVAAALSVVLVLKAALEEEGEALAIKACVAARFAAELAVCPVTEPETPLIRLVPEPDPLPDPVPPPMVLVVVAAGVSALLIAINWSSWLSEII